MKTNLKNFSSTSVNSNNKGKETRGVPKFVLQSGSPYDNPQGRLKSERGWCVKGGIYPGNYRERCPICESNFRHFEPNGLWCPHHPQCRPSSYQVRFGKLTNRFKSYEEAFRRLTGWRHETDLGKFDIRDYRHDNPLGFANLAEKFLESKRLLKGIQKYRERLSFAINKFQNRNVKEIVTILNSYLMI